MAASDLKVTASVEAAIHKAVADTAQKISDQYGIKIESVNFGWLQSTDSALLIETSIQTSKTYPWTKSKNQ